MSVDDTLCPVMDNRQPLDGNSSKSLAAQSATFDEKPVNPLTGIRQRLTDNRQNLEGQPSTLDG